MQVELVVTCTDRKTVAVPEQLRIRHLVDVPPVERVAHWTGLLECVDAPTVSARDLYAGDHWAVVKETAGVECNGLRIRLWVCSAGYGLVPWETTLKPYSATFSPGHSDSVGAAGFTPSEWWDALQRWRPMAVDTPRSLAKLATFCSRSYLLICLSEPYMRAAARDLAVVSQQRTIASCGIVSAGVSRSSELASLLLPADGRWKERLGGAMQSLNARLARWALQNYSRWQGDGRALHTWLAADLSKIPPLDVPARTKATDREVKGWIARELASDPPLPPVRYCADGATVDGHVSKDGSATSSGRSPQRQ